MPLYTSSMREFDSVPIFSIKLALSTDLICVVFTTHRLGIFASPFFKITFPGNSPNLRVDVIASMVLGDVVDKLHKLGKAKIKKIRDSVVQKLHFNVYPLILSSHRLEAELLNPYSIGILVF